MIRTGKLQGFFVLCHLLFLRSGLGWVRSGIFFGRKPIPPSGRGSGLVSMGVKMVSGSACLLPIPPFLHPAI